MTDKLRSVLSRMDIFLEEEERNSSPVFHSTKKWRSELSSALSDCVVIPRDEVEQIHALIGCVNKWLCTSVNLRGSAHQQGAEEALNALVRRIEAIVSECATESSIDPLLDESPWWIVGQKLRALLEEDGDV